VKAPLRTIASVQPAIPSFKWAIPHIQAEQSPSLAHLKCKSESIQIFSRCWNKLERKYGPRLVMPKEIVWLMGSPGSGKSYNSPFILEVLGLDNQPLTTSSLLTSKEAEEIKKGGGLVDDTMVLDLLLEHLLHPENSRGVVVDGFPRTRVQADFVKLLAHKMDQLYSKSITSFPSNFSVLVLYVNEQTSLQRQIERGRLAKEHNEKVKAVTACMNLLGCHPPPKLQDERLTDTSIELARKRFRIFEEQFYGIEHLKQHFPFHVVDTSKLDQVEMQIGERLRTRHFFPGHLMFKRGPLFDM